MDRDSLKEASASPDSVRQEFEEDSTLQTRVLVRVEKGNK